MDINRLLILKPSSGGIFVWEEKSHKVSIRDILIITKMYSVLTMITKIEIDIYNFRWAHPLGGGGGVLLCRLNGFSRS